MGYVTDDGVHEMYLAVVFADGRIGGGWAPEGIPVSTSREGLGLPHGQWEYRSPAEVVGWRPVCMHGDQVAWSGQDWVRVEVEQALAAGRDVIVSDDDVWLDDREDIHEAICSEWRSQHVEPAELVAEIRRVAERIHCAAADLQQLTNRLRGLGGEGSVVDHALARCVAAAGLAGSVSRDRRADARSSAWRSP